MAASLVELVSSLKGLTPKRLLRLGRNAILLTALLFSTLALRLPDIASASPIPFRLLPGTLTSHASQPAQAASAQQDPEQSLTRNPRGEALLFENAAEEIQPLGLQMCCVSLSPDGKTVATAHGRPQSGGEIRVWDRDTAKVRLSLPYKKGVRSIAFSPDGKVFVSGAYDGAIRFHDPKTFAVWGIGDQSSGGHTADGVNSIHFFKSGHYLATGGFDKTIRLWDVSAILLARQGEGTVRVPPVAILEGNTNAVLSVSGSEDGKTVLSGGFDRGVRLWDLPDRLPKMGQEPLSIKRETIDLAGHESPVEAVAISPDGQYVASAAQRGKLQVRERSGQKTVIAAQFNGGIACLAFSSDGKYLAVGGGPTKEVRIWAVAELKEVTRRNDFGDVVKGLEFAPGGKMLVVALADQSVHFWPWAETKEKDKQTLTPPSLGYTRQPFQAAAVSPDGSLLAFCGESQSVFIFNRPLNKLVAELSGHEDAIAGLAFSPDGKKLATSSYDKTIKLWDTESWKVQQTLGGHTGWVFGVAFSPDGKTVVSGSYDKSIRLWDVQSGKLKATWKDHSASVRSVAFSPDGKKLVSGGTDRFLRIWDVLDGKVLLTLKGHKGVVRSVAFSPDGKSLASGCEDQTVKLWDAETGNNTHTFSELQDMVTALGYSPKGQTLAIGTSQGRISVLDPLSGRTRQLLRAHTDSISALLFADQGQKLLSFAHDRMIRQWSVSNPSIAQPEQALTSTIGIIAAVASTPNGAAVALGSTNGSIATWDLKSGKLSPFPSKHSDGVLQLAISDEMRIASIGKDGVLLVTSKDGKETWNGKGTYAKFTPDGKFLAVAESKEIVFRESTTGKELKRFAGGHEGEVVRLDFSADGMRMISAGHDTKVRLWDVASGDKLQQTPEFGNGSTISHLAFSPDGSRFAVSANGPDQPSPDDMSGMFRLVRDVRVYTVPKAEAALAAPIYFAPQPVDQPVTGLHWSGQNLVMQAPDGTVRVNVFEADGAREVKRFQAHEGAVLSAVLANDVLVTAGEDMTVRRWASPLSGVKQ